MSGEKVSIAAKDGGQFNGYLSLPPSGKGPGLIVIQEIFGVNAHIRSVADRYAKEGFVALAPDIFWRIKPGVELNYTQEAVEEGRGYAMQCDPNLLISDLKQCEEYLKALTSCTKKVAAVGYCLGGKLAYRLAAHSDIDAAVSYYGGTISQNLDEAKNIKCPIIFHFGENDAHIPLSEVKKIEEAFAGSGKAQVYVYAGADHGFNCDMRASYNAEAAALAYSRSLDFLRRSLGEPLPVQK